MKALVTGFEPFGGDSVNPAGEALDNCRRASARWRSRPGCCRRCSGRRSTCWKPRWRRRRRTSSSASASRAGAPRCRSNGWRSTSTMRAFPTMTATSRSICRSSPAVRRPISRHCRSRPQWRRCARQACRRSSPTAPAPLSATTCSTVSCISPRRGGRVCAAGFCMCPICRARRRGITARRRWRSTTSCAASRSCSGSPRRGRDDIAAAEGAIS